MENRMKNINEKRSKTLDPVDSWLGRMSSTETRRVYRHRLETYCRWAGLTPQQLLALKDDKDSLEAEHLLDSFVSSPEFSDWQKVNIVTAIKSFYSYSYKALQKVSGKASAVKQTPYRTPTKETLRKFIDGAWSHRDKALVAFVASTFFREGTIPELNWGDIEDGALLEPGFVAKDVLHVGVLGKHMKGGGKGRYAGIQQHTFLTAEACALLMEYKRSRTERGEQLTKETPLFVTDMREAIRNDQGELTGYKPYIRIKASTIRNLFAAASKRSGIKFSPHDFRRYGQTQLEEAGLVPNWIRKILGHKVKGEESPYSRPKIKQLREAYRRALPHLTFLSEAPSISESDLRIKLHFDGLRNDLPSEVIDEMERKYLGKDPRTAIPEISLEAKAIQRIADREGIDMTEGGHMIPKDAIEIEMEEIQKERKRRQTAANCANGHNCHRIVGEDELPALLSKGWHVAAVLPSGKVVVEK